MSTSWLFVLAFCFLVQTCNASSAYYGNALKNSLLFFEAQRSGKLPPDQRIRWRGDSAVHDGQADRIDLEGGYYDAGDNVKFGFPLAFTVTMLAWSAVEFKNQLQAQAELGNALSAVKWGTDYLIKAHPQPDVLYGEVGSGASDHACWQRPEDMTTPRNAYRIDDQHPGADLAGETAAAFAASAVAFKEIDPGYSRVLLDHARQLFEFARAHPGRYQTSISDAGQFYSSSGYEDELLWAAAWLHRATDNVEYLRFIEQSSNSGGTRQMFSWDDKYVGAQVLVAKGILEGKIPVKENLGAMKYNAEQFICNCIQKGNSNVKKTNGGLLWFQDWANLQYVTSASFVLTAYAEFLSNAKSSIKCGNAVVWPEELNAFARSQVDYILGANPKRMSYMVGFGANYPKQVHHRGASIVSIKRNPVPVDCHAGFDQWFRKNADNPNVLVGAIVGGPDQGDQYNDVRDNVKQSEPATANNAPLVGVLAKLAAS